ncbi:hypothetical protein L1889_05390 [Paenalcaligenes niemegkensis]|uniref:hypothetical protein n=1 Tax=Paenalcaligenes niemegkensis TaxID=2895469 RepID=UPI001EE7B534|nr:hypothetical protein [Paenalcaligenes niemegkensis]MCQ9616203.1 hypothetical protein [Paenalcaligenes niemegkensis]
MSSSTVHAHPKHPKLQSISLSQSHVIMAGAGHAVAPDLVRRRIENSEALWARAHRNSRNAGRHITHYSAPVDAAWGRKGPTFDWLTAWEAEVPQRYTKKGAKP